MKFLVNLVIVLLVIPVNIKKIANLLINSLMILKIKVYLQTNMLSDDEIYAELKRRKANKSTK